MPLFNKIRKSQIKTEGMKKYLLYAIGEIVLVVVGILIALQIDNWNNARKIRETEIVYLKNIRHDLEESVKELDRFIAQRKIIGASANEVIANYEGKPVTNWNEFNKNIVTVYEWARFFPIDHTFQEMSSSGNLSIISNDSIKNGLLELDVRYKKLKFTEDHFRFDTEKCLYEPVYGFADIRKMADNFHYQMSEGKSGKLGKLEKSDFEGILKDIRQKNGFVFATMYMPGMNQSSQKIKDKCELLISLIDKDIAK
jgi:hypothetical protein